MIMTLLFVAILLIDDPPSPAPAETEAPVPSADNEPPGPTEADAPKPKRLLKKKGDGPPAPTPEQPATDPDVAPPVDSDRPIPKPDELKPPSETDEILDRDLGQDLEAADNPENDPLSKILTGRRSAEEKLAGLEKANDSIEVQENVVKEINELLQRAQQQSPSPSSSKKKSRKMSQKKPSSQQQKKQQQQASNNSRDSNRETIGPPAQAREKLTPSPEERDVWGHLSEQMREEMNQYAKENFLVKYRDLIERYYTDIARQGQRGRP
jgi:hypothetical protein